MLFLQGTEVFGWAADAKGEGHPAERIIQFWFENQEG